MGLLHAVFRAMTRLLRRRLREPRAQQMHIDEAHIEKERRARRHTTPSVFAVSALSAGAFGASLACGPSFQLIYECDVHFEHCYALEEANVTGDLKRACWRQWLATYNFGQARDRVEYAARHAGATSQTVASNELAPVPAAPASAAAAVPAPTNAFLPPPNVATVSTATATAAFSATLPDPKTPGRACGDACEEHWKSCRAACGDAACDGCDRAYRACMPACFR